MQLSYDAPLISAIKPRITAFTVGRQILITNHYEDEYPDDFSVTPSIGIAYTKLTSFDNKDNRIDVNKTTPIYKIEVGKDAYMGRVIGTINYTDRFYFGIGIRAFFR
jgi:hypothetical protein